MKPITAEEYSSRFFDDSTIFPDCLTVVDNCRLPARKPASHKYQYGRALIIGGSVGFSGAPILAANACERSGAGLTHLMVPESIYSVAASRIDGAVVTPLHASERGGIHGDALKQVLSVLKTADACAIGPGLGRDGHVQKIVEGVLENAVCPVVLDADALTVCGKNTELIDRCEAPLVLTPHEGEFRRLGGKTDGGRLEGAMHFVAEHRKPVLVLKGYGTLVCSGNSFSVNASGGPAMAKGGSGDVLCGMICAFLAQGFNPLQAARSAVFLHGRAGDLAEEELGAYSVTPSDLIHMLPAAMKRAEASGGERENA